MKKSLIFLLILLILIGGCSGKTGSVNKVCFGDKCFNVELAVSDEEKSAGLMQRPYLEKDKGMLFVYEEEGIRNFWMKNTLIPLDIIWINKNNEVVFIKENAQPCNEECPIITPDKKAIYVLEVNSGLVKESNIILGKKVILN